MQKPMLLDLHFDKGNGALFSIAYRDLNVRCWLSQENGFLVKKASPGQNFCEIFERYESLIAEAALFSIERNGVSEDIWGNEITAQDIEAVQLRRRQACQQGGNSPPK